MSAERGAASEADKNVRAPQKDESSVGRRRKQEGAVYTPAFITRYLVEQALGGMLKQRFEALRQQHEAEAAGTALKAQADPNAYDLVAFNGPQRKAIIRPLKTLGKPEMREYRAVYVVGDEEIGLFSHEIVVTAA